MNPCADCGARACAECGAPVCVIDLGYLQEETKVIYVRPERLSRCRLHRAHRHTACKAIGETEAAALARFPHDLTEAR